MLTRTTDGHRSTVGEHEKICSTNYNYKPEASSRMTIQICPSDYWSTPFSAVVRAGLWRYGVCANEKPSVEQKYIFYLAHCD